MRENLVFSLVREKSVFFSPSKWKKIFFHHNSELEIWMHLCIKSFFMHLCIKIDFFCIPCLQFHEEKFDSELVLCIFLICTHDIRFLCIRFARAQNFSLMQKYHPCQKEKCIKLVQKYTIWHSKFKFTGLVKQVKIWQTGYFWPKKSPIYFEKQVKKQVKKQVFSTFSNRFFVYLVWISKNFYTNFYINL